MDKTDKKSDRIPVTTKTRLRLKKYYVNNNFKSYEEAITEMLNKVEKSSK